MRREAVRSPPAGPWDGHWQECVLDDDDWLPAVRSHSGSGSQVSQINNTVLRISAG